jgi:ssDNA thymidine ADP-ribosyltransferase, DarT
MPGTYKRPTLIYRLTHYSNLEFTLRNGMCCKNSPNTDPNYINIGHKNLIDKRGRRPVSLSPFGVLNDYIPFYFAPRSPMLYSIHKGNIDGFAGNQSDIIYLVSSIEKIQEANIPFVFTDGHAYELISDFYNDLSNLEKIDWQIMGATYWNNTPEDNDRMRKRMAEFLVYQFVPSSCILAIVVPDDTIKKTVNSTQAKSGTIIQTLVKPNWYY